MDKKTNNRILIIGVDKEIHDNIKEEFVEDECSFVTTFKGKDGLLKFRDSRFDIIILDEIG